MRTPGQFYIPRRKSELIAFIRPHWKGTLSKLQVMDKRQLRAILYKIRDKQFQTVMQKPLDLSGGG